MNEERIIGVFNEWGRLREAALGQVDDLIDPEYIPALVWVSEEGKKGLREKAGIRSVEGFPEEARKMKTTIDTLQHVLEEHGVIVHRTGPVPEGFQEETTYLKHVQKGNYSIGGADFFRVIGTRVILLNSFHLPFRRSYVWCVRRMLEPLLENSNATYISTPPPSPHYTRDELYLENGDIMIDGHNVYVGMSGNATTAKGVAWLRRLLGNEYRVHTIRLQPDLFHIDWLMSLNRPGLLTYCPEALLDPLPDPLAKWDKIAVRPDEVAGANNLSIDENTIVVPEHLTRICDEYDRRGMKVITIPALETIDYGSGPRCLTAILRRDP